MKKIILPLFLSMALGGCKATEALNDTISMSGTTSKMSDTTSQMAKTTDHMSYITTKMQADTSDAMHNQTLKIALDAMASLPDTVTLVPPSASLLGGAQFFARYARTDEAHTWKDGSDEIMNYFYVTIKNINQSPVPNLALKACPGVEANPDCTDADKTQAGYIGRFNHGYSVKLMQLQAVAGQVAQSVPEKDEAAATVEKIILAQIPGGLREQTVYQFLYLRAKFINDILLENQLFADGVTNMAQLRDAYQNIKNLQFIADLPFASKIAFKTSGFYNLDGSGSAPISSDPTVNGGYANIDVKFDPQMVKDRWNELLSNLPDTDNDADAQEVLAITAEANGHIAGK